MFDVIARLWRRNAIMGVVVDGTGGRGDDNVVGVITKETRRRRGGEQRAHVSALTGRDPAEGLPRAAPLP